MKKKLLLPMMAFVCAIGLSFATERSTADAETDYIWLNGQFQSIGMEITECGSGEIGCTIQFGDGPVYDLYDSPGVLKEGNGTLVRR